MSSSPTLTADQLTMIFHSNRTAGLGRADLWQATRASPTDEFGRVKSLGPAINSTASESAGYVSADGLVLLFSADRSDGSGGQDLYFSMRATRDAEFGSPISLGSVINTPLNDTAPTLTADGRTLYFNSNRPGSLNKMDIWVSRRVLKSTTSAVNVPPPAKAPFEAKQARAHQEAWAKYLDVKVEMPNSVGQSMILIPPGEFMMGSTDEQVTAALKLADELNTDPPTRNRIQQNERPQHKVEITKPFFLSATEVTVGQFKKFVEAAKHVTEAEQIGFGDSSRTVPEGKETAAQKQRQWRVPGYAIDDNSPVCQITLSDAKAYCQWLSTQEKRTYRLPSEAEWEYACRAGTTTQYSFGDDHNELSKYSWHRVTSGGKSNPVAAKLPNDFGLFDMYGNLFEWCGDFYEEKGYEKASSIDPSGPSEGFNRVLRGGSWSANQAGCRSATRYYTPPSTRNSDIGFRVVAELNVPAASVGIRSAASSKLFIHDPAFQQWMKNVQAMPAEQQIEAVSKKMVELNPGFDGKLIGYGYKATPEITNGVVITIGFDSEYPTDISPIRAFAGLKTLRCTAAKGGKLSDLSPLQGMKLSLLYCSGTLVRDLSPLEGMPLDSLFCDDTQVADLSPLAGMKLVKLLCKNTPVSDVQALHNHSSLKDVKLIGTNVTPASIAALQKALPNCKIDWDDSAKPTTNK